MRPVKFDGEPILTAFLCRASLPDIFNIFALWIILFFVWAIFYVEVFGLTRWSVYETRNQNYSSFWQAMVMLALASTG